MKIDVGPRAPIIGTKKVTNQGTVTGLKDYAGKNVLIVVPTHTPRVRSSPEDYLVEAKKFARAQAKRAAETVKDVRVKLEGAVGPTAAFLAHRAPARARPPIRKAETRVRQALRNAERQVTALLV